jgi:hypothetical protein
VNPPASVCRKRSLLIGCVAVLIAFATPIDAGASNSSGTARPPVRITERDFDISAPKRLPSGNVVVRVRNGGPDDHELLVVRSKRRRLQLRPDGITVDEEALEPHLVGVLEAGPASSTRTLRLHLRPGRYEMFCNMSGHYLGGMRSQFVVTP